MLQVYYLNLKNSNLTEMKPCLPISISSSLLSPQHQLPMLGLVVVSDGTNLGLASTLGAKNFADIRERNFSKAEGIKT